jgi:glyoxylase-like metal-dependent hydrolase (beta-lactamase superfamily II)
MKLYPIESGNFKLDGGAMFGVVPKSLWSRTNPADSNNMIDMAARCLLIENGDKLSLIDTGMGDKQSDKFFGYYYPWGEHSIDKSLKEHGFHRDDITDVFLTHLHFDHCGGSSFYNDNDELELTFPDATYHVVETHWENANDPNAREKASFLPENINPIKESGKLNLVKENHEYETGLTAISVNGHTIGQQLPKIEGDDKTLVFVADLLPTHIHVPLPWVMGYDMYPVQTLAEKNAFLKTAASKNWNLYLEHDAHEEIIRVQHKDGRFSVSENLTLNDV